MTLSQSLIVTVGCLAVMVVAGLLLNSYLKHQNDKDPLTGKTDTPIADEPPVEAPVLKVKEDANTDITNPPKFSTPTTTVARKRNAKGQFTK